MPKFEYMKTKHLLLLPVFTLISFTNFPEINPCYISFNSATDLGAGAPDRYPANVEKTRTLDTEQGTIDLTIADGYSIMYLNNKYATAVTMKVEISKEGNYEKDQKTLIANLNYLNKNSERMETKELIVMELNGYKFYGLSRGALDVGSVMSSFIMFPGNGVIVYLSFTNLKPEVRTYETVEDYKKQRDRFMDEYTRYLNTCKGK